MCFKHAGICVCNKYQLWGTSCLWEGFKSSALYCVTVCEARGRVFWLHFLASHTRTLPFDSWSFIPSLCIRSPRGYAQIWQLRPAYCLLQHPQKINFCYWQGIDSLWMDGESRWRQEMTPTHTHTHTLAGELVDKCLWAMWALFIAAPLIQYNMSA